MKKPFKHTKVGKFLKGKVFKTVADVAIGTFAPAVKLGGGTIGAAIGVIKGTFEQEKKANLESEGGGIGKYNPARFVGYVLLVLTILYITGVIDEGTFYTIWDIWESQTQ